MNSPQPPKRLRAYSSPAEPTSSPRLLRLNVGGHPYDLPLSTIPLLQTMMTDRWLSTCLIDSDKRIFLDRDGELFGDILRWVRGGREVLEQWRTKSGSEGTVGYLAQSNAVPMYTNGSSSMVPSGAELSSGDSRRLQRLRIEADYYGLHQLVRDIDVVTVGKRVVFEEEGWARVAGGFLLGEHGREDANDDEGDRAAGHHHNDRNLVRNEYQHQEQEQEIMENENEEDVIQEDGSVNQQIQQEDEEESVEDEDGIQAMEEEEEEDDDDEEEEQLEFEEEPEDDNTQPPSYKKWSWSRQYGNPNILRPHPTQSQMIVGQDGTYLMMLRFTAALPSPLARIKWDQEEEEDRRVTRGALRRSQRGERRRHGSDGGRRSSNQDDNRNLEDWDDEIIHDSSENNAHHIKSKEVEEDYFVIVNIEAPLQTVMDYIDESQTHFPLLRAGLWDYRTEEEVLHEDPVFATVCAMDVVSLRAGDKLTVSYMNDETSRESAPFPDDTPPELMNSLTLIKINGNTLAKYERLKSSPVVMQESLEKVARRRGNDRIGNLGSVQGRGRNARRMKSEHTHHIHENSEVETDGSPIDDCDHEMEEFDRSLTRTAFWTKPRNDFPPTPFQPSFSHASSLLEFPHSGHYLLLGRVAVGCRRDATFLPVLSGGPLEGHRAQMSLRSAGGRLLHAVGAFAFEDKPRLGCADLSILSENGMFNDIVYVPKVGTELSISTTGDCRLHPEGTEVGPFCSAVSQSLSVLLLDDDIMEVDRYMVGTVRKLDQEREIKWFHTPSASVIRGQGKGGTLAQPSLFDIDGHRLVWRGYMNNNTTEEHPNQDGLISHTNLTTVLVIGSIPPLHRGYVLGLLQNNMPVAISITPESLDAKGRHCHYFQEIIKLRDGDEITIAECGYGGEGERGWRDHLFTESRLVELDTMMGHLSFVVLQHIECEEVDIIN